MRLDIYAIVDMWPCQTTVEIMNHNHYERFLTNRVWHVVHAILFGVVCLWYCMELNGGVVVWYYIYSVVQYSVVLCGDVSSLTWQVWRCSPVREPPWLLSRAGRHSALRGGGSCRAPPASPPPRPGWQWDLAPCQQCQLLPGTLWSSQSYQSHSPLMYSSTETTVQFKYK